MAKPYAPRAFFRQSPNRLLKKYFKRYDLFQDLDWKAMKKIKIEPLYQAWLQLPDNQRDKIEQDFQNIHSMANHAGMQAIIDEAKYYDEDLTAMFARMKGYYEPAFWTLVCPT